LTRLERLLKVAGGAKRLLVLTHDNPDPDAVGSAVGLVHLVESRTKGTRARAAYGGIIGRAENRAMIKTLALDVANVEEMDLARYDMLALVDTQPGATNHPIPSGRAPDIVIDHHISSGPPFKAAYAEVDTKVGATATLVARHLFNAHLQIPPRIATALLYGIKSDTQDLGRQAGPRDIDAFLKLYAMADKKAIPRIVYAPVPRRYFHLFEQALRKAKVCGRLVLTHLEAIDTPDVVAEVADLLLRLEECDWAAATGRYQGKLLVSLRTSDPAGEAGRIIQRVLGEDGSAGGHGMMAGGNVPTVGLTRRSIAALEGEIERKLMAEISPKSPLCEPLGKD